MDQTQVQKLSQKIESLESKVNKLETTVTRLESENKELLRKVGSLNALAPKDECNLWCR